MLANSLPLFNRNRSYYSFSMVYAFRNQWVVNVGMILMKTCITDALSSQQKRFRI